MGTTPSKFSNPETAESPLSADRWPILGSQSTTMSRVTFSRP
jgi:hypothetical protein